MKKKELSQKKKGLILVGCMFVGFISAALFSLLIPDDNGGVFRKIILEYFPILIGLFVSILSLDRSNAFKIGAFFIGLGLILPSLWFLSLTIVIKIKIVCLYLGGFLGGYTISKSRFFNQITVYERRNSGDK